MGVFSEYDMTLRELQEALSEPSEPIDMDEVYVESAIHSLIAQADDLIIALNRSETAPYVIANRIAIGQALVRVQLLASSIDALKAPRLVHNA